MGLEGVIASRAADLYGIVNGIDAVAWNPASDGLIASDFNGANLKKRAANKVALTRHFGLDEEDGPLFSIVSRLTWQKGIDLMAEVVDELVAQGGRLAVWALAIRCLKQHCLTRPRVTGGGSR